MAIRRSTQRYVPGRTSNIRHPVHRDRRALSITTSFRGRIPDALRTLKTPILKLGQRYTRRSHEKNRTRNQTTALDAKRASRTRSLENPTGDRRAINTPSKTRIRNLKIPVDPHVTCCKPQGSSTLYTVVRKNQDRRSPPFSPIYSYGCPPGVSRSHRFARFARRRRERRRRTILTRHDACLLSPIAPFLLVFLAFR